MDPFSTNKVAFHLLTGFKPVEFRQCLEQNVPFGLRVEKSRVGYFFLGPLPTLTHD